jgi:hypothetical protein
MNRRTPRANVLLGCLAAAMLAAPTAKKSAPTPTPCRRFRRSPDGFPDRFRTDEKTGARSPVAVSLT